MRSLETGDRTKKKGITMWRRLITKKGTFNDVRIGQIITEHIGVLFMTE